MDYLSKEATRVGDDQADAVLPGDLGNPQLLVEARVGQHDDGEVLQEVLLQRSRGRARRHVVVELGQLLVAHRRPVLAHVSLA